MGQRTFQAGNCFTLTLYDWQRKGGNNLTVSSVFRDFQDQPQCVCPLSALLVPIQAGPLSIGKTLPHRVESKVLAL